MENPKLTTDDINKILLQRRRLLIVDTSFSSPSTNNEKTVISILKNIEDLGFVFSRELFEELKYKLDDYLIGLYHQLVLDLSEMVGSQVKHEPFYKNFPQQMASLSELDLFMNALVHYWSNGRWQPEYVKISRIPIQDSKPQTRVINLGELSDFHQIFTDMIQTNGSLSLHDQNLLGWYIKTANPEDLIGRMPEVIPSKEILGLTFASIIKYHPTMVDLVKNYLKTATDVLRIVTTLSGGDNSLANNTRFRSFSRAERRFILGLLDQCPNLEEDMGRYPGKWKRLGEKLHPGDYSKQYTNVYRVFTKIRNGEKLYSFAAEVEKSMKKGDLGKALSLLERRPGEFARRLDFLARSYPQRLSEIVVSYEKVVNNISTQVLLQVIAHFKNRNSDISTRSFFPKGNIAKVQVIENNLPDLPGSFCIQVILVSESALLERFKEKRSLGNVFIDPILKDIVVPIAQRSSSRTLKTYARGSMFDLASESKVIRAFIHWKNITLGASTTKLPQTSDDESYEDTDGEQSMAPIQDWRQVLNANNRSDGTVISEANPPNPRELSIMQERIDIDLSLGLYDAEWNYKEHISYTNLRSESITGIHHSGDIVDAPEGASEFIDMDVQNLLEHQVRYAVFNVYSYTTQGYDEIPECFFGWMEREEINSGEIFEPKTVVNKIDLTSPTIICLPVIFDLKLRKAIWMDVSLRSNPNWVNNLEANSNNVVLISKALIEMNKPNLFDLFMLNAQARGELVDDPEQAEITFGIKETDDITPFHVETILSEFM